jgi:hypothetical protein
VSVSGTSARLGTRACSRRLSTRWPASFAPNPPEAVTYIEAWDLFSVPLLRGEAMSATYDMSYAQGMNGIEDVTACNMSKIVVVQFVVSVL